MNASILAPLAAAYAAAVSVRTTLYSRGWLSRARAAVPVISIGNIAVGGTGKTPLVAMAARLLKEAGLRPAIVSRGYGGRRSVDPLVVSGDSGADLGVTAASAGDEPVMLGRCLPGVPVIVARRRSEGAALAIARFGAGCVLLDDGFQHLSLHRDLDVVLLDERHPLGTGRLLPAGVLREPPAALERADAIVLSGEGGDPAKTRERLAAHVRPGTPYFGFRTEPTLILRDGVEPQPAGSIAGRRVVAFAGIARPERLRASLEALGARVVEFLPFPDHHVFGQGDLRRILGAAKRGSPELLVTTEKDLVRIEASAAAFLREAGLAALRVEGVLFGNERAPFREMLVTAARRTETRT